MKLDLSTFKHNSFQNNQHRVIEKLITFAFDQFRLEHGVKALGSEEDDFIAISEFLQSLCRLSVGEPEVLTQSVGSLRKRKRVAVFVLAKNWSCLEATSP